MVEAVVRSRFGQLLRTRKSMQGRSVGSSIGVLMGVREAEAMKRHKFTLILAGVAEITPEVANALYEATDGDIELNLCDGIASLEFDRQAPSLREAITSAIRAVEGAGVGVRVVRVESEVANTIARINASLLGVAEGD